MWISSRRSQAVLLTLFAMGGLGFGVTLWCADGPPLTGRRWRQCPAPPSCRCNGVG